MSKVKIVSKGHANNTKVILPDGTALEDIAEIKILMSPRRLTRAYIELMNVELDVDVEEDSVIIEKRDEDE